MNAWKRDLKVSGMPSSLSSSVAPPRSLSARAATYSNSTWRRNRMPSGEGVAGGDGAGLLPGPQSTSVFYSPSC